MSSAIRAGLIGVTWQRTHRLPLQVVDPKAFTTLLGSHETMPGVGRRGPAAGGSWRRKA